RERPPFYRERNDDVELTDFEIAPQAFVWLVADAEIVNGEPVIAGLFDIIEEKKLAGARKRNLVLGNRTELADHAANRAAGAGDSADFAANLECVQHEGRFRLIKGFGEDRAKEVPDLRFRKDIGDTHLAEADFLHGKERFEGRVRFRLG